MGVLSPEQTLPQAGDETSLPGVGLELRDVHHRRDPAIDEQVGNQLAAGRLERHIAVQAAEDRDREASGLAIGCEAQRHHFPTGSSATNCAPASWSCSARSWAA